MTTSQYTSKHLKELNDLLEIRASIRASEAYLNATIQMLGQQYTKKYLYFIVCGDVVKIGVSNKPDARLEVLQTGAPGKLILLASIPNSGHRENECHKQLEHLRVYGEWFRYTSEIDDLIQELKK